MSDQTLTQQRTSWITRRDEKRRLLESVSKYMEWCFPNDLEKSLRMIGAEDKEIEAIAALKGFARWPPEGGIFLE